MLYLFKLCKDVGVLFLLTCAVQLLAFHLFRKNFRIPFQQHGSLPLARGCFRIFICIDNELPYIFFIFEFVDFAPLHSIKTWSRQGCNLRALTKLDATNSVYARTWECARTLMAAIEAKAGATAHRQLANIVRTTCTRFPGLFGNNQGLDGGAGLRF